MEPREKDLPGVLMEFKAVSSTEQADLAVVSQEALSQINRMNYAQELRDRGVGRIIKYGIAFSGKNVVVMAGE